MTWYFILLLINLLVLSFMRSKKIVPLFMLASLIIVASGAHVVSAQTAPTTMTARNHQAFEGQGGGRGMMGRGVVGTVSAVNGTTLTITSRPWGKPAADGTTPAPTTYTVDASSAQVTKDKVASSISAIAIGDTVMVQGTVTGSSVKATKIRDGLPIRNQNGQDNQSESKDFPAQSIQGNGQPIIAGTITTVSGKNITITNKSNASFTVDATNAQIRNGDATSSVSTLTVGDRIIVQGTINGNAVVAYSIIDSGQATTATNNSQSGQPQKMENHGFFGGIGSFFSHLFGF